MKSGNVKELHFMSWCDGRHGGTWQTAFFFLKEQPGLSGHGSVQEVNPRGRHCTLKAEMSVFTHRLLLAQQL